MPENKSNIFVDVFNSLRALPIWVQIWGLPLGVASYHFHITDL